MDKICLDTDFLADLLRKNPSAEAFVKEHEQKVGLATTYVNLFELYNGAFTSERKETNLKAVELLKERLVLLNLTDNSVKSAGQLLAQLKKEGTLIDFRDLFIGCIAREHNYAIKTNNIKHFSKIPNLRIV